MVTYCRLIELCIDAFKKIMSNNNLNSNDEIMCSCSGTTRSEIQRLFGEGLDIDAISRRTGALSGCAGCEWDVIQLLKALSQ